MFRETPRNISILVSVRTIAYLRRYNATNTETHIREAAIACRISFAVDQLYRAIFTLRLATSQRELNQTRDRKDDPRSHSSKQLLLYSNRVLSAFKVSVHAFFRAAKLITRYRLSRLVVPGQRISNRPSPAERASAERESADLVPVVVAKVIRLSLT